MSATAAIPLNRLFQLLVLTMWAQIYIMILDIRGKAWPYMLAKVVATVLHCAVAVVSFSGAALPFRSLWALSASSLHRPSFWQASY